MNTELAGNTAAVLFDGLGTDTEDVRDVLAHRPPHDVPAKVRRHLAELLAGRGEGRA